MSKYRNRIEIVADILNIVKDGARKTQIMYKGNLSYKLLTQYLGDVIGSGLVIIRENANMYQLTEKGAAFLKRFDDYTRSRTAAEQHLNNIKSLRQVLEEMCIFKHMRKNAMYENGSDFQEES